MEHARDVTIKLHHRVGRYVQLQLYFASKWIMLSEVSFISGKQRSRFQRNCLIIVSHGIEKSNMISHKTISQSCWAARLEFPFVIAARSASIVVQTESFSPTVEKRNIKENIDVKFSNYFSAISYLRHFVSFPSLRWDKAGHWREASCKAQRHIICKNVSIM